MVVIDVRMKMRWWDSFVWFARAPASQLSRTHTHFYWSTFVDAQPICQAFTILTPRAHRTQIAISERISVAINLDEYEDLYAMPSINLCMHTYLRTDCFQISFNFALHFFRVAFFAKSFVFIFGSSSFGQTHRFIYASVRLAQFITQSNKNLIMHS